MQQYDIFHLLLKKNSIKSILFLGRFKKKIHEKFN